MYIERSTKGGNIFLKYYSKHTAICWYFSKIESPFNCKWNNKFTCLMYIIFVTWIVSIWSHWGCCTSELGGRTTRKLLSAALLVKYMNKLICINCVNRGFQGKVPTCCIKERGIAMPDPNLAGSILYGNYFRTCWVAPWNLMAKIRTLWELTRSLRGKSSFAMSSIFQ